MANIEMKSYLVYGYNFRQNMIKKKKEKVSREK